VPINNIKRNGLMLVLSSPSGAGKTTLTRELLQRDTNTKMSVSVTTREPRVGEENGIHYFFVSKPEFEAMRDNGDLLEWARVFDNYYGTPRKPIEASLACGMDMVFDIDWQGTQQLRESKPAELVSVFVLPPSSDELERRLRARAQDPEEIIKKRMSRAADETSHWAEYDYVFVNHEVESSLIFVESILQAERLKRVRQFGLPDYVRGLFNDA
jgi:guanylate kinase